MTPTLSNLSPLSLDLTGLPKPVVDDVKQFVAQARASQTAAPEPRFVSRPRPSQDESRRLLEEMAAMSSDQSLPVDFSTTDIYDDCN